MEEYIDSEKELDEIERFKDPEVDYHGKLYSRKFSVPPEGITDKNRSVAKPLNFAMVYDKEYKK